MEMEMKISLPTTGPKAFPPASAPADVVRAYIAKLLVDKYDVPADVAEKHADKWEIGRFSQLTAASRDTVQRIFGDNVGLCIHIAIREELLEALNKRPSAIISSYAAISSSLALASILVLFILPELGLQANEDRILWLGSSFWWFLSAACWIFYAIKHPLNEIKATFSFIGGFCAIVVGFNLLALM